MSASALASRMRRAAVPPLLLLGASTGCSSLGTLTFGLIGDDGTALESVTVVATANANTNMATALDIVFIHERGLVRRLPTTAPKWFQRRAVLSSAHADALDIVSLEIPPGHTVENVELPDDAGDAVAVRCYANYVADAGQAPLNLTGMTHAVIRLLPRDVVLSTAKAAKGGEG